MSEDPLTPKPAVLVELEDDLISHSPVLDSDSPTTMRPSMSPTSSTPSSSPDDKGLKQSELLSSEESLVDSQIIQEDNCTTSPIAKVGEDLISFVNLTNVTPIVKEDIWEDRAKASPAEEGSGRNEVNPSKNQKANGMGKQVGSHIPVIDLEGDCEVDLVVTKFTAITDSDNTEGGPTDLQ